MKDVAAGVGIAIGLNGLMLLAALVVTAALGSGAPQQAAILGVALAYLVTTWRALVRFGQDRAWSTFQRHLVFAAGHFLTLRFVLEIALAWLGGAPEA